MEDTQNEKHGGKAQRSPERCDIEDEPQPLADAQPHPISPKMICQSMDSRTYYHQHQANGKKHAAAYEHMLKARTGHAITSSLSELKLLRAVCIQPTLDLDNCLCNKYQKHN